MIRHPHVTAAVLAGGGARRLGGAIKPLLPLGNAGDTPLSRVLRMVEGRFPACLVVAPDPSPYAGFPVTVVSDRVAGRGPLAGVEAALGASSTRFVLMLGGDMPSVSGPLVDAMVARARPDRLLVPRRAGRPEPLHALYPVSCLSRVSVALDEGVRMMRDFFERVDVDYLEEDDWMAIEGAARSFDNINTPEDLGRARMRIISVAAPGNGSGKTSVVRGVLAGFPGRLHAIKFTTVYRDGANCPRTESACACRELKGPFTVVDAPRLLEAPDTDTARMALAGAASVLWCLARPGAHADAWEHLKTGRLGDGDALVTEGNMILSVLQPDFLLMVMSPAVPRARWKADTWELVRRASRVVINTHEASAADLEALAREVAAQRRGEQPIVADVTRPM